MNKVMSPDDVGDILQVAVDGRRALLQLRSARRVGKSCVCLQQVFSLCGVRDMLAS